MYLLLDFSRDSNRVKFEFSLIPRVGMDCSGIEVIFIAIFFEPGQNVTLFHSQIGLKDNSVELNYVSKINKGYFECYSSKSLKYLQNIMNIFKGINYRFKIS